MADTQTLQERLDQLCAEAAQTKDPEAVLRLRAPEFEPFEIAYGLSLCDHDGVCGHVFNGVVRDAVGPHRTLHVFLEEPRVPGVSLRSEAPYGEWTAPDGN